MRTGSEAAVCMRAMRSGEVVREVISQVPAVSCIHVPTEEMVEAIQRLRSGAKPSRLEGTGVSLRGVAGPVSGVWSGMWSLQFTWCVGAGFAWVSPSPLILLKVFH